MAWSREDAALGAKQAFGRLAEVAANATDAITGVVKDPDAGANVGTESMLPGSDATATAAGAAHDNDAQIAMAAVFVVFLAISFEFVMDKFKLNFIPISVFWILLGAGTMWVVGQFETEKSTLLNPEIFFFLLIPPIIFNAGYGLEHSYFFGNFSAILGMAFFGSLITAVVIGTGLYLLVQSGIVGVAVSIGECFLFGALLSATDPVGVMSVLNSKAFKKLDKNIKTVIIGESMLNDAIAITLFKTFETMLLQTNGNNRIEIQQDIAFAIARFIYTAILSLFTGCAFGFGTSAISHSNPVLKKHPKIEMLLTVFSAYICYCLSEFTEASGMIAVFTCGLVMAHYHQYNMSDSARVAARELTGLSSLISEVVIYLFLGMTCTRSLEADTILFYDTSLIVSTYILCQVARAIAVFFVAIFVNYQSSDSLNWKEQVLLWFAGVRGAIPFALAVQIPGSSRGALVMATLALVIITTMLNGTLTAPLAQWLGLNKESNKSPGLVKNFSFQEVENLWADFDTMLSYYFGGELAKRRADAKRAMDESPIIEAERVQRVQAVH
uniref:Sodium/hydrogen exchanger n=1 Tax=Lotharella globosa TaxID=91324 RepID=A0A7S4DVH6_9EUKA|mmetsp:Transcript_20238/g.40849  ORF Transcript_20238/g.40849 Transcript_20238/m.40849 type:complete len:555 (-) Transcript_20238:319-1983(-)|eukprot:CAMPEP_0167792724 /NCGR_PEP_ID=MMETSP0111_2-20121227/12721_1 /TAXON_ID=91324 /ORGANISM="Lotharella globosa, Strain CCCM811" /LENGTH=554 /DNA_ID=CAMNT_0007685677 /DNA_START=59 /DNA_END=1723 /DNA_ORIENTATION=-